MPSPAMPPPPTRPLWPRLLLVALVSAAALAWAQAPAESLYGYDGPYHIKYSAWLRDHGLDRRFPWWQETFLKDRFADKDLLYHVLLIPFTYGDLLRGGKAASLVFGTGLYVALFLALARLGARAPVLWSLAGLAGSTTLVYRAGLLRSHVLAIALALLGAAAILRGRRVAAAGLTALYCLSHIGWHLLPGLALLHDAVASARARRPRLDMLPAVLAGAAVGILLNPYLPNNLEIWWVQNVTVLSAAWSPGSDDLSMGLEMRRGRPRDLVFYNLGPLLFTAAGMAALLLRPGPARRARGEEGSPGEEAPLTLGLAALGLLGLSLMSRRFVEFWAPFSVLFAAMAVPRFRAASRMPRRLAQAAPAACALAIVGLAAHHLVQARRIVREDRGMIYTPCASWIRDNVPAGATVFTTDWDEFPELFFVAPEQRYLVGLDPTFMYVTDRERWRLWRRVAEGRAPDLYTPIRETFGCRAVFADAGHEAFVDRADQDPHFRLEAGHADCSVYSLRGEEGGGAAVRTRWRGAGGRLLEAGPRDFVDVARLAGHEEKHEEREEQAPCAALEGEIAAEPPGAVRLGVSTDDAIRIAVAGTTVFDSEAGGPPALEEFLRPGRGGPGRFERVFEADLPPGYNRLTVTTCRAGMVWGFHLRAVPWP